MGIPQTQSAWQSVLVSCGVRQATATTWAPVFLSTIKDNTFSSPKDLPDFLGQMLHESANLEQLYENLNYTAPRLMQVWPSRFKTLEFAQQYAGNPQKLANLVYSNRMGNGNEASGDGWTYRARGFPGITGKANYDFVGRILGQDLLGIPDLLGQPHYALEGGIAWWENKIPDSMLGDVVKITQVVNGGSIGLTQRQQVTGKAVLALNKFSMVPLTGLPGTKLA